MNLCLLFFFVHFILVQCYLIGIARFRSSFDKRTSDKMTVTILGESVTYDILATNAFNSDRKRMSMLLRRKVHLPFYERSSPVKRYPPAMQTHPFRSGAMASSSPVFGVSPSPTHAAQTTLQTPNSPQSPPPLSQGIAQRRSLKQALLPHTPAFLSSIHNSRGVTGGFGASGAHSSEIVAGNSRKHSPPRRMSPPKR